MAGNILFQSPNGPDLSHMLSTPGWRCSSATECDFMDRPAAAAMAHDNHPLETRAWRLIMLPLGKQADGKPAYHLLMALSIDFHLHYINELKAKLISAASIISLLIIAIVLFVVYQGISRSARSVARSRILPRGISMCALTRRRCLSSWSGWRCRLTICWSA